MNVNVCMFYVHNTLVIRLLEKNQLANQCEENVKGLILLCTGDLKENDPTV